MCLNVKVHTERLFYNEPIISPFVYSNEAQLMIGYI